jgi:LmbE family N-acetylglucosaminyl deacetylase
VRPDVILTHCGDDAHQDHRKLRRLTWTTFRDHLILEYEIPKWDGDLGRPNVYLPLTAEIMERKLALLDAHFATQRGKDWFDAETFRGLARLRGMECRAAERYAEAFTALKLRLG